MKKLWDKKGSSKTNKKIEDYTVGVDYLLDLELLPYDIQGTMAHAKMLYKIKILNAKELKTLLTGLNKILSLWKARKFKIDKSQEDGHTAIETYLTENYSDVGKKVHTGRSRNDQSLTMTRLFSKEKLFQVKKEVQNIIRSLEGQIKKRGKIKMPGYTHMQRAMPSSVGMWLGSFHASLEDDLILLDAMMKIIDQNPLGSAAGYGENILGLNRKFTTKEFDFFTLPDSFKTGSSIMPQKKNYDVLELIRGNVGIFNGFQHQIENVVKNLPLGYNRDFQLTKEPYIKGMKLALDTIEIMTLIVKNLKVKKQNLENACTPELYATDEALKLVKKGKSFREAYQEIKEKFY